MANEFAKNTFFSFESDLKSNLRRGMKLPLCWTIWTVTRKNFTSMNTEQKNTANNFQTISIDLCIRLMSACSNCVGHFDCMFHTHSAYCLICLMLNAKWNVYCWVPFSQAIQSIAFAITKPIFFEWLLFSCVFDLNISNLHFPSICFVSSSSSVAAEFLFHFQYAKSRDQLDVVLIKRSKSLKLKSS